MPKTKSLTSYVRTQAASCLGLTPHSTDEELRTAVRDQLSLTVFEDVFDLDPTATDDLILGRKIAAAQLLLTDHDDRRHSRRMVAFSAADSRVPESRKVFRLKAQPVPGEQLALLN